LSRFEAVDAPATFGEEVGMAGEEDNSIVPPTRAADDRGDGLRQFASPMAQRHAEGLAAPTDRHAASVANDLPAARSALDASPVEAREARAPSRHDAAPTDEPQEEPLSLRPTLTRAMPASMPLSVESVPMTEDAAALALPGIDDRISPWRAQAERPAEPSIDTRTTTQAPIPKALPQQRDKPGATVDDTPSVVQVTIGKLEVRAPDTPRQAVAKPMRAAPRMSLQDYLQRRTEGRGR
jgi:hypothetical protein